MEATITIHLHHGDLPAGVVFPGDVAVDCEAMGLKHGRDRLCLVQLSGGDGVAHLVKFNPGQYDAPNLRALLADDTKVKLFHFARFDLALLRLSLGILTAPVYCTRTASKLARTYTDKHGLKEVCKELLNVEISKQQQSSDWGTVQLSQEQMTYAAADVLHLHALRDRLNAILVREGRMELAHACFMFLPIRAELDLAGWADDDLFSHG